jgi:heme A synthase
MTVSLRGVSRLAGFAWSVLVVDVAVAAWGAYVRATGSGAGCGRHWPLCDGEIVPLDAGTKKMIEFSHRVSSGFALVLTFALLAWVWRAFPPRHAARKASAAAAGFMIAEALLGAALVLFELVNHDASMKRALSVGLHLVNTFFLLASTALTAWWVSGFPRARLRNQHAVAWILGGSLLSLLLVGASGALTALGDTLFPASSLSSGIAQDFSPGAHLFVRLRALHPLLAGGTAVALVVASPLLRALRPTAMVRLLSRGVVILVVLQVGAGLLNLVTLAPVWLQLVHLVLADGVWIATVLTGAAALAEQPAETPEHAIGGGAAFT